VREAAAPLAGKSADVSLATTNHIAAVKVNHAHNTVVVYRPSSGVELL